MRSPSHPTHAFRATTSMLARLTSLIRAKKIIPFCRTTRININRININLNDYYNPVMDYYNPVIDYYNPVIDYYNLLLRFEPCLNLLGLILILCKININLININININPT